MKQFFSNIFLAFLHYYLDAGQIRIIKTSNPVKPCLASFKPVIDTGCPCRFYLGRSSLKGGFISYFWWVVAPYKGSGVKHFFWVDIMVIKFFYSSICFSGCWNLNVLKYGSEIILQDGRKSRHWILWFKTPFTFFCEKEGLKKCTFNSNTLSK